MKTCICIQLKNEHLYLKEWLDAQFDLGFDKVFVVEDNGSRSHKGITDMYGDRVEVFSYSDIDKIMGGDRYFCSQECSFEWFMNNHFNKGEFDWCLFIDVDEFLEFKNPEETLETFLTDYSDAPAIGLYWKNYGANGHYKREKGTVEELYKSESNIIDDPLKKYTKIFVNLNYSERYHFTGVHIFQNAVDTDKTPINFNENQYYKRNYNRCWINHYRTKSLEDWKLKLSRGFVINKTKNLDKFFKWNPNMCISVNKFQYKNRLDIENIILPPVEKIEMDAFFDNINLKSVKIPEGVKIFDKWCFGNCEKLQSITFPKSTKEISMEAFKLCTSLKTINFLGTNIKKISNRAFQFCTSVENLILPEGLEVIDEYAFADMLHLKTVTFPSTLKRVDDYAFKNCVSLENIIGYKDSIIISNNAFNNCINLSLDI